MGIRGILIITVDCLRADHVSCYGYHRPTTPTIDALADQGHLWEQAHSVSCWTRPSVASIFTGLYPTQHGAFEYIKGTGNSGAATTDILRSQQPTLAETLTSNGWRCGAFMRNEQLGAYTKLDRGFEAYIPNAGKAPEIIRQCGDWLRQDSQVPTFAYLHLLEAHWPYRARDRQLKLFGGDKETNYFRDFTGEQYGLLKHTLAQGDETLSPQQLEDLILMYDACVRRVDEGIADLLKMLDDLGIRDEMAIIVTADHGEEFLDHGGIGHGQELFNELIHVPMVMSIPSQPGPKRYSHPVSQVDLADTVLMLAGISGSIDQDAFFSTSTPQRPIFAERRKRKRYSHIILSGRWKFHRRYKFKIPNEELDGYQTTQEMMNKYRYKTTLALYDLLDDPLEQSNLAGDPRYAAEQTRLTNELDQWWNHVNTSTQYDPGDDVEMDPRVVERLRDLGYID